MCLRAPPRRLSRSELLLAITRLVALPCRSPSASALVIDVPPKIWRPKPKPCYVPRLLPNEFDDDLFVFPQYGDALCRPTQAFAIDRTDLRCFQADHDMDGFAKGFALAVMLHPSIAAAVSAVIQNRWDCFYEDGARNSILGFEFAIDTGGFAPVCCPSLVMGRTSPRLSWTISER